MLTRTSFRIQGKDLGLGLH